MNKLLAGALFAALLGVSACSSVRAGNAKTNPAPCPNIIVLDEASRIIDFDGEAKAENIAYSGEITNVSIGCRYVGSDPIKAEISVNLALGKGPKGADDEKEFKYFVAVTRKDIDVITKKEFLVKADFSEKKNIVLKKEDVDKIIIPRADDSIAGGNFEIVVGFAMSPAQVIFNRSGKSLKFPNLQ